MSNRAAYIVLASAFATPLIAGSAAYALPGWPATTEPSSGTVHAPIETQVPRFGYARNLSSEVYDAVRRLDGMHRTHYGRGLPVFHIGPRDEHYIVVRGTAGGEVFEAYLKADKYGNILPNTPVMLVRSPAGDSPKAPLLLAPVNPEAYEDRKRYGVFTRVGPKPPALPEVPENPRFESETEHTKIERGLETVIRAVEAEARRLAVGGQTK